MSETGRSTATTMRRRSASTSSKGGAPRCEMPSAATGRSPDRPISLLRVGLIGRCAPGARRKFFASLLILAGSWLAIGGDLPGLACARLRPGRATVLVRSPRATRRSHRMTMLEIELFTDPARPVAFSAKSIRRAAALALGLTRSPQCT
jgi:hypothetical protein